VELGEGYEGEGVKECGGWIGERGASEARRDGWGGDGEWGDRGAPLGAPGQFLIPLGAYLKGAAELST